MNDRQWVTDTIYTFPTDALCGTLDEVFDRIRDAANVHGYRDVRLHMKGSYTYDQVTLIGERLENDYEMKTRLEKTDKRARALAAKEAKEKKQLVELLSKYGIPKIGDTISKDTDNE
jgi:hypothetical protein